MEKKCSNDGGPGFLWGTGWRGLPAAGGHGEGRPPADQTMDTASAQPQEIAQEELQAILSPFVERLSSTLKRTGGQPKIIESAKTSPESLFDELNYALEKVMSQLKITADDRVIDAFAEAISSIPPQIINEYNLGPLLQTIRAIAPKADKKTANGLGELIYSCIIFIIGNANRSYCAEISKTINSLLEKNLLEKNTLKQLKKHIEESRKFERRTTIRAKLITNIMKAISSRKTMEASPKHMTRTASKTALPMAEAHNTIPEGIISQGQPEVVCH